MPAVLIKKPSYWSWRLGRRLNKSFYSRLLPFYWWEPFACINKLKIPFVTYSSWQRGFLLVNMPLRGQPVVKGSIAFFEGFMMPIRVKDGAGGKDFFLNQAMNFFSIKRSFGKSVRVIRAFCLPILQINQTVLVFQILCSAIVGKTRVPKGTADRKDTRNLAAAIETVNSR